MTWMTLGYLVPVLAKFKLIDNPIALILVVCMPILTGIIASLKGRSSIGWFLYGLLLWPVAIIHAIVIEPNREKSERRQVKRGKAKRCPHCAELVRPEARVCKHCQRDLPAGTGLARKRRG